MEDKNETELQAMYELICTESQLRLIMTALERYFRLGMGQFWSYCDDLCFEGFDYDQPEGERRTAEFTERIARRDLSMRFFESIYREAIGHKARFKTPDEQRIIDIWQTIRYQLWKDKPEPKSHMTVDSDPPLNLSGDAPVVVRRVE